MWLVGCGINVGCVGCVWVVGVKFPPASSTTNGQGASTIGVEDAGGNFTATNVETVLAEIAGKIPTATTADYTVTNGATNRTLDAHNVTLNDLADIVGTLITDLIARNQIV